MAAPFRPARNRASLLLMYSAYREPPFRTLRARAQRAVTSHPSGQVAHVKPESARMLSRARN